MQAATQQKLSLSFSLCKGAPSLSALIWECLQHRARVTQGSTGGKGEDLTLNIDSRPWLTTKDTPHRAAVSTPIIHVHI